MSSTPLGPLSHSGLASAGGLPHARGSARPRRVLARVLAASALALGSATGARAQGNDAWLLSTWSDIGPAGSSSLLSLAHDRSGFLWVGAQTGLVRFDGVTFERAADVLGTSWPAEEEAVVGLCADRAGDLWAVQRQQVIPIRGARAGTPVTVPDSAALVGCRAGREGAIWFLGEHGLWEMRDGVLARRYDVLRGVRLFDALEDGPGDLLAATSSGLWRLTGGGTATRLSSRLITALARRRDGRVFAGGEVLGLVDGDSVRPLAAAAAPQPQRIRRLVADARGGLWIATHANGLWRLDGDAFASIQPSALAQTIGAEAVTEPDGTLWLASLTGELARLRPAAVQRIAAREGLASELVFGVVPDGAGGLWAATLDGLTHVRPSGEARSMPTPCGSQLMALARSPWGLVAVGGARGVVCTIERGAPARQLAFDARLPILDLAFNADTIWAATAQGLFQWHGGALRRRLTLNAEPDYVPRLAIARGRAWLVRADGLRAIEGDTLGPLRVAGAFLAITTDADGSLWLSGRDGSLVLVTDTSIGRIDGALPQGAVQLLVRDSTLWAGATLGIFSLGTRALRRAAVEGAPVEGAPVGGAPVGGAPVRGAPVEYTHRGTRDGLPRRGVVGPGSPGVAPFGERHLAFATAGGIAIVDPAALVASGRPRARVRRLIVDGRPVELADTVRVMSGSRVIAVEFAAPGYPDQDVVRYRYRVVGLTGDWSDPSAARSISFASLPPGHYRVEIGASDDRGVDGDAAGFALVVRPRWWEHRVLQGAGALLLLALGLLGYRARLRAMERRQRELETIVATRTRDLAEANRRLDALSRTDALTQLPNRRELEERLALVWSMAARQRQLVAVAMIDVDRFKSYNDHYGHAAGDACLRVVADRLRSVLRRRADLLARYGGEEFILLLPQTAEDGARTVVEAMRQAVWDANLPHAAGGIDGRVTVSIGLAVIQPTVGDPSGALLERADAALYRAKADGRNRVVTAEAVPGDRGSPAHEPLVV